MCITRSQLPLLIQIFTYPEACGIRIQFLTLSHGSRQIPLQDCITTLGPLYNQNPMPEPIDPITCWVLYTCIYVPGVNTHVHACASRVTVSLPLDLCFPTYRHICSMRVDASPNSCRYYVPAETHASQHAMFQRHPFTCTIYICILHYIYVHVFTCLHAFIPTWYTCMHTCS